MTTEYQIRGEKIQYDINREAAKISALSSGKIDTYEYLTGEEILPSNQQKMGKAFEKQTKTIKDQGEKQADDLKALKAKELKPKERKPIECDNYFINGLAEIGNSTKTIDFDNLNYNFTGDSAPISFIGFKGPLHIFKSIYDGDIAFEEAEKDFKKLKLDLGHIKQGPKCYKSPEQLNTIENIKKSLQIKIKNCPNV